MFSLSKIITQGFFFITLMIIVTSCKDDNAEFPSRKVSNINEFIYDNMNFAYFWSDEMPNIDYRKELDSEAYFYKLLQEPDDKWSFITDDINELIAYFNGIQKTFGFSIQPYYLKPGSNQVVIFVEYVYRDSPAEAAGLKRGDVFYKIDGIVINDKNYQTLLSKEYMVLTLGLVDSNQDINGLSPAISLSSVVMNIHPIVALKTLEIAEKKVGYLAYTAFRSNYDTALVNNFQRFKAENITDLVLDLRYNGGGDVSSAQLLAGLIAPTSAKGSILIREKWNPKMTNYIKEVYGDHDTIFNRRIQNEEFNLNLSRLFVLTTSGTASASEMIIYGLSPYMEIIQIGEKTHGKYYGSITIDDPDEKHTWAIQPIVMRSENADNSINYTDGLPPTFSMIDNNYNADLGDPEENFLYQALTYISTGDFDKSELKSGILNLKAIKNYKNTSDPMRSIMLLETPLKPLIIGASDRKSVV